MFPHSVRWPSTLGLSVVSIALALSAGGCKKKAPEGGAADEKSAAASEEQSIQNIGSDTMVNLAQAWAEAYSKVEPKVSVEVSGGGSGVGVAQLINGTAQIANCSRKLEPEEIEKAKAKNGHVPQEFLVGYDGLAIYVHKDNPLESISMEQLAEIYREGGKLASWSALGVKSIPGAKGDEIVRVSRQNNSGTYHYFREAVVGKNSDFKQGSLDMNGSKDVVELVGKTPGSIGYSGLGYATSAVKVLKVSAKDGAPVLPSVETVLDKSYPIARPLYMYTPGQPEAHVKKYLDWILSSDGQALVKDSGYVPLAGK